MLISLLLLACGSPAPATPTPTTPAPTTGAAADDTFANVAPAKVLEVVDCADRALARVQEAQWVFWVSLPKQPLQVGDQLLLGKGPLQKAVTCGEATYNDVVVIEQAKVVTAEQVQAALGLKPPEGGLSIAEVVAKRAELAGKPVTVRGRVVKLNKGIFGKNWMHIVDGSQDGDLTITSDSFAEVGQLVTASAILTIDKDLGFGYFYSEILEDAALTVE